MSSHGLGPLGAYDGNTESSQKAPLNAADAIAQGASAVSANGSNPWGVPQKDVRELLGRIHGHLAGRSGELQNALREALTKTAGAAMSDPMGQLGGLAQSLPGFPRSRPTSPAPPGAQGTPTAPAAAAGPAGQPAGNPIMEMLQKEALAIVGIVVDAVQQWYKDGKLNLKCVPSPSPRESSVLTKAMLPQTSKVADPATTLSVPRPHFACPVSPEEPTICSRRRICSLSSEPTTTTTTTFVSPENITEITWLVMPPTPLAPPVNPVKPITHFEADPVSAYMTPSETSPCHSRRRVSPSPRSSVPELPAFSFPLPSVRRHRSEPSIGPLPPLHPARSHHNRLRGCAASDKHITSFPALMMRHSTNDWLTPPADVDQTRQKPPPDQPQALIGQTPRRARIVSVTPDRSSQGPLDDSSASSVLTKLGNGSRQIGQALSSALVGDTGTSIPRRDSSAVRLRAILDRFPPLPQPDNSGIFEALTGARQPGPPCSPPWRKDRAGRLGTCSEDGLPHVCRVASESGSSASSVMTEHSE